LRLGEAGIDTAVLERGRRWPIGADGNTFAEASEQVGPQADRIVEAVGLQGPVAVDNQGRKYD
jgi:cholesterol oxidase